MKKNATPRILSVMCLTTLLLHGCVHLNTSIQRHTLVTAQGDLLSTAGIPRQLVETLEDIQNDPNCDNFILFVHGRGKHPEKAFKQRLLVDLESDYSAKVLMFHWPSWDGPLAFPQAQARASADTFISVLAAIKTCKQTHTHLVKGIRFTLLTQSMGSLVLEEAVQRHANASLKDLFDTLVMTAPASHTRNHATWVDAMHLSPHTYIVFNRYDPVLASAGLREMDRCLGKGLKSRGETVDLASNAMYIDASRVTLLHRYYLHRYLKTAPALKAFFDEVLNGLPATLPTDDPVVDIHGQKSS
ncbi:MAG: alpha/beta hydrolase [Planctomycetes bacterium]|nr:alpha/beta hydrolase [Planctomycetota bacterium]